MISDMFFQIGHVCQRVHVQVLVISQEEHDVRPGALLGAILDERRLDGATGPHSKR